MESSIARRMRLSTIIAEKFTATKIINFNIIEGYYLSLTESYNTSLNRFYETCIHQIIKLKKFLKQYDNIYRLILILIKTM
jgi:hypothetical protein